MFLYAIDGTGDSDDSAYRIAMEKSFSRRLRYLTGGSYWRGPGLLGWTTLDIADEMIEFIKRDTTGISNPKIYLVGHSRGGAAVIRVAQILEELSMTVDGMFLFDAADPNHHLQVNLDEIPTNTKKCFHARRDRSFANHYASELRVASENLERCVALSKYLLIPLGGGWILRGD